MEESEDGKFHTMDEDEKDWKEFRKSTNSAEAMENMARKSVELSTKLYKKQMMTAEKAEEETMHDSVDGEETVLRGKRAKVGPEEWKYVGLGPWRKKIKKSKLPPDQFLRAAIRPFTYRNLVKEIVLTRHAILDGDIGKKE